MKTKKGDFIEIDFTAAVKDGNVFDTTIREEALKAGLINKEDKREFKSLIVCIGQGMVIGGFDKGLENREPGKEYEIELKPNDAFGMRKPNLVRPVPLSAFKERPVPGMFVDVDGIVAKVINATGGRTLLDFNPPLAGKVIVYKFKINKIINETDQKIKALAKTFGFELTNIKVEESKALIKLEKSELQSKAFKELKKKVKELLEFELEVESS